MNASTLLPEDSSYAAAHRVLIVLSVIFLMPILTYTLSLVRGTLALRDTKGRVPPIVPFSFPLVAHVPEFLWNIEGFFDKVA